MTIGGDRNVIKKDTEKILKCKDLTMELESIWNLKIKVMPVIIGANRTISQSCRKRT